MRREGGTTLTSLTRASAISLRRFSLLPPFGYACNEIERTILHEKLIEIQFKRKTCHCLTSQGSKWTHVSRVSKWMYLSGCVCFNMIIGSVCLRSERAASISLISMSSITTCSRGRSYWDAANLNIKQWKALADWCKSSPAHKGQSVCCQATWGTR